MYAPANAVPVAVTGSARNAPGIPKMVAPTMTAPNATAGLISIVRAVSGGASR